MDLKVYGGRGVKGWPALDSGSLKLRLCPNLITTYASFCQWTKRVWAHACFVTWMLWLKAAHPISWIYCGKQALMFYVDLSQSCCFPLKLKPQHLIVRWYFLIFRKPTTALISHRNQSVSKLEKLKPWHEVKLSTNKNASNNFEFVVFFLVFFFWATLLGSSLRNVYPPTVSCLRLHNSLTSAKPKLFQLLLLFRFFPSAMTFF